MAKKVFQNLEGGGSEVTRCGGYPPPPKAVVSRRARRPAAHTRIVARSVRKRSAAQHHLPTTKCGASVLECPGYRLFLDMSLSMKLDFPYAHHIPPVFSVRRMPLRNATAFWKPSLTLIRLSSCSMEMAPS